MSDPSAARLAQRSPAVNELRLEPPPPVPARMFRSFPEMKEWDAQLQFVGKRNHESIRKALGAAAEQGGEGSDYVAVFEANL